MQDDRSSELAYGPLVLIADDNEDGREMLGEFLEQLGMRIIEVATGPDVLDTVAEMLPDVVLLDLGLPGLDGLEVARRLRASAASRNIPIVMHTACALASQRRRAVEAGCNAVLTKPCRQDEVADTIRRVLASRSPG